MSPFSPVNQLLLCRPFYILLQEMRLSKSVYHVYRGLTMYRIAIHIRSQGETAYLRPTSQAIRTRDFTSSVVFTWFDECTHSAANAFVKSHDPTAGQDLKDFKNVIYEGTPHGNAKLAYSKIILVLNPIPFFL